MKENKILNKFFRDAISDLDTSSSKLKEQKFQDAINYGATSLRDLTKIYTELSEESYLSYKQESLNKAQILGFLLNSFKNILNISVALRAFNIFEKSYQIIINPLKTVGDNWAILHTYDTAVGVIVKFISFLKNDNSIPENEKNEDYQKC